MSRFQTTDLSAVDASYPNLVLGVVYEGWASHVFGPTGVAKTLIAQGLGLQGVRAGIRVGHGDMEMGAPVSAQRYRDHGASDEELRAIAFWDMPAPTLAEADEFLEAVLATEVDLMVWDKLPDFLRSASLAENSNDDVNTWMAAFIEPLRGKVASLILDATGWNDKHARGGSEKGFKVGLAWQVEVLDQPSKAHVGLVRWTCTKDRFGAVGVGATIDFQVGGDGSGRITFERVDSLGAPHVQSAAEKRQEAVEIVADAVVQLFRDRHARGETERLTQRQVLARLPGGYGKALIEEGIKRARFDPRRPITAVDGPRKSLLYGLSESLTLTDPGLVGGQSQSDGAGQSVTTDPDRPTPKQGQSQGQSSGSVARRSVRRVPLPKEQGR